MRLLVLLLSLASCQGPVAGGAGARERITAVGSSTVYPFTALIAERFVDADPAAPAPVIESTGTGAGFRLFCAGTGTAHPDIVGASRRMRAGEYRLCARNGVGPIVELRIGRDGLAFAQARGAVPLRLSNATLYRALAEAPGGVANTARTWHDVDAALPPVPIRVYGPPATSGTRDALAEMVLAPGCAAVDPGAAALPPVVRHRRCTRVREDGAYVDAGENDNLTVRKLRADQGAVGVFGYGYLEANRDTLTGIPLDGVRPDYAAIASGRYPGARPLFLYVRRDALGTVPGLADFLARYLAAAAPNGPLVGRGLIASPPAERAAARRTLLTRAPLDPRTLA
ncbi:substrate-binding domain-containing protein [Sphingomonas rubra]|uniref:Phosphate transport system substrate-binding protein n=1 Tax=Sphingomonas rubra TaxID=634430 RepID=A0A1I5QPZ0_9SPHN|nr:substrate-binding domain-containing protein [Sphingomonas rubra]SFP48334.1 phosphate transport system substrate-binding protein [Sphingomonas rubra]